ncbi:hypothetical protein KY311_00995, partial [Candidatus Woesearchaeota archaeon]|nr:hypothetical protein [Candidatus Woesearchaeota archaeon]
PIVKKPKFEVHETESNVFHYRSVLGIGEVHSEGILYVPYFTESEMEALQQFDKTHSNYCLATLHECITKSWTRQAIGGSVLNYFANPSVILDITKLGGLAPFAAHVEQYMREGRVALMGVFTGELGRFIQADDTFHSLGDLSSSYSPTKLTVKADEIEQKANVEVDGEIKGFEPL